MNPLNKTEKQAIHSLSAIYALRMIGLFMVIPIITIYVQTLPGATPLLIGVAMGCYGLSQALLQMPFGLWSDHQGRKFVIAVGLSIFIFGSVIAALSHTIWGIIIGRTLQGAGAIGSTTSALAADLTRSEQRTKAMAIIGMSIGVSFFLAMFAGPFLNGWLSVASIFGLSAFLGLAALLILKLWVPALPKNPVAREKTRWRDLYSVVNNPQLLPFNLGILLLHFILTANFIVIPLLLLEQLGLPERHQWYVYLPALLLTFISIAPLIRRSSKSEQSKQAITLAIVFLGCAELLLIFCQHSILGMTFSLWVFFTAFTMLEALLPSATSKIAPANYRGAAMGFFSSCQFLGIFLGGVTGGWLYGKFHSDAVLLTCAVVAGVWLLVCYNSSLLKFNGTIK